MLETAVALNAVQGTDAENRHAIPKSPPPLIELLPVGVYACDDSGRLCWFNHRAAELWGRVPRVGDDGELFCGSYRLYALDGTLIRGEETPMATVLRTGEPVIGTEAMVERPDGSRFIAMVHINPIKDAGGVVIGAINAFHSVSEMRERDRQLHERERQLRELLDALPAAIYMTDANGRVTYYNEPAVTLAGRRPELGVDEWCVTWRLYHPDGTPMPHDECPMAIALRENRPVRGAEAVAERPDGTQVPFIPYPTPLHDAAGNLVGAVNMLVDISHRKEAETQQRVLFSELNHRTKNNMQMLHAMLSSARRETANAEAQVALGEAIRRIGAMAAAQAVLYRADSADGFQARDFLISVCGMARQAFCQSIAIEYGLAEGELSNDTAAPLALILNELVTNAAKHGSNEHGHALVKVGLFREDGAFVLRVEDGGSGFELSSARRRSSGLGLVMGLVRQIGGSFTVERMPGARCTVRFPDESGCR